MPEHSSQRVPRRLAILHYHLQPGGVTTVIEQTVAALQAAAAIDIAVLSGRRYRGRKLNNVQLVPALQYPGSRETGSAETLADDLEKAARLGLRGHLPDIWHCHNHSLGKNLHLPDALGVLIERGHRLLLQIHDFAEDGRPQNFAVLAQAKQAYALRPAVHYATINSRDRALLIAAGLPEARVHPLANPVVAPASESAPPGDGKCPLLLYPTRGIRRKNLGEAVLLAALCRERAFLASTRAPDNPRWQAIHNDWSAFARERRLPIALAVVDAQSPADFQVSHNESTSFAAWMESAACVLTTSVAEGFGLAYLESLVQGLPLLGRDLPEITVDFRAQGLAFPGLYRAIAVPLTWIGEERLLEILRKALEKFYRTYEQSLPPNAPVRALRSMVDSQGRVDFGRLPEILQKEVIDHILREGAEADVFFKTDEAITPAPRWLDLWFEGGMPVPDLAGQRQILARHYSREAYSHRLLRTYDRLLADTPTHRSDDLAVESKISTHLLKTFLSPERFQFLRS